ncbi:MAG: hypothetical protein K2Z81_16585 [Cyanobacteria bacterium]|nr:hypothetical protein [Cyanobacteriota bacterium]
MASYDYKCKSCTSHFTIERSVHDSSECICTECGSTDLARIWNVFISGKSSNSSASSQQCAPEKTVRSSSCCGGGCH